ncbi:cation:proton antiporter [Halobaculum marinum]|uniref:Cation:proton antiporter n=1 Tax=Halobaculum marinum TaxID=3031996 RepID=A0ABD5WXU3_9EURY|nr:sodium:proton antiporter [Halobaculum sp. DT55]
MTTAGVEDQLFVLLYLFSIAAVVGVLSTRYARIQYTTGLLIAGLLVSLVGSPVAVEFSSDVILLAILPALIFNDAVTIDVEALRSNLGPILALAVGGLLLSVAIVAIAGQVLFGFTLAVAVLFGAIVMPTDPVSVLATFDDLGVPERLKILVEGESLLNDGVSIVVYSTVLAVFIEAEARSMAVADLVTPGALLADIAVGIVVAVAGGAAVGGVVGYLAYELIARVDDDLTAVVITLIVAYGVYLLLDVAGSSGVIGTLTAGLFMAARPSRGAISRSTQFSVGVVWGYAAFIGNTILFVAIGVLIPIDLLLRYAPEILVAVVVVFLARAVVVYPLVAVVNRRLVTPIPRRYQHVLTWSGIHASVSIALVLGVAESITNPTTELLSALVFGVAAVSLLVNGPTMGRVVSAVGIQSQRPAQKLYQTLVGRLHGVDAALESAQRGFEADDIPESVFEEVIEAYRDERDDLEAAIETLLRTHPDVRDHEERLARRRVLRAEYQAINEATQRGDVDGDVAEELLENVEARIDAVETDSWSVGDPMQSDDHSSWRTRVEAFGLDVVSTDSRTAMSQSSVDSDSDREQTR